MTRQYVFVPETGGIKVQEQVSGMQVVSQDTGIEANRGAYQISVPITQEVAEAGRSTYQISVPVYADVDDDADSIGLQR